MIYFAEGSENGDFSETDLKNALYQALDKIGKRDKVLVVPPDNTRYHSKAGELTNLSWKYYKERLTDILPALGTHSPMNNNEIKNMFGDTPLRLFRKHHWRKDLTTIGEVPSSFVESVSEGKVHLPMEVQINKLLVEGGHDLILSIGQVVPHEVIGMANYNKNIFVGVGGSDIINKSHFLGAVCNMERVMGKVDSPVRSVLDYASDNFAQKLPIVYVLTVLAPAPDGILKVRGLFIGDDRKCFEHAAALSGKVNITMVEKPLKKVVVYLDPLKFRSTWLGNKAIYRTRMAMGDDGEIIILAPGLRSFGEDREIDQLIRKYGYRTTGEILGYVENNRDLSNNLCTAAHLIHGSTENRFKVTYCPGKLTREEIESVNYGYKDLDKMIKIYNPLALQDGYNIFENGEEVYYISDPAIGLWALKR